MIPLIWQLPALALVYLQFSLFAEAAPPRYFTLPTIIRNPSPSLFNSTVHPSTPLFNVTANPRVFCETRNRKVLTAPQRRECKSAVAHLPYAYPDIHTFGPYEPYGRFRTPISSNHSTRCEARVTLVKGMIEEISSWRELKYAAWDLVEACLNERRQVGFAMVGEESGLKVELEYHYE